METLALGIESLCFLWKLAFKFGCCDNLRVPLELQWGKLKNGVYQNQWADYNDISYVASRMQTHHHLLKLRPWIELDLLHANLVTYAFVWEKMKIIYFSKTIAAYDIRVGKNESNLFFENYCSL